MASSSFREDIWHILNDPDDQRYRVFLVFINGLILLSVGLLFYETLGMEGLPAQVQERRRELLEAIDRIILFIFLLEYIGRLIAIRGWRPLSIKLGRWGTAKYFISSRLKFILSPWGIIDLLALLPLAPFLRSLRVLRLLRLFRSVKLFRHANPLSTLSSVVRDNTLLFSVAFGMVLGTIVLSAVMFFFAEYDTNEQVNNIGDTLWWSIVTVSTVGFGDITPSTPGGRVIGAALMIAGMFVIATFAGVISSTLVGHLIPLQMERVRMSSITDHIVIAGWNDNVPMLLEQFEAEDIQVPQVIIFAPMPRPENLDPKYMFIHGDFTRESEYDKVRLKYARTVVVISDTSRHGPNPSSRDATSVLTVFTIRRLERHFADERTRPIHICAEILDPENVEHARVAGADEVLATALVGNNLLAHTASNPGIGSVLNTLLLATRDNIYTSPMPAELIDGKLATFRAMQQRLRDDYDIMLLGVVHGGEIYLNPSADRPIFVEDQLIYIGSTRLENL